MVEEPMESIREILAEKFSDEQSVGERASSM